MTLFLNRSTDLLRQHRRSFVAINVVFYGLVLLAMLLAAFKPDLQTEATERANAQLNQFTLGRLTAGAYEDGDVLTAAGLTFALNVLIGTLLVITLPSLVVPFWGMLLLCYRAYEWGLLFSPIGPDAWKGAPHLLTLLVEGQAYVVAALPVWLHGCRILFPRTHGYPSRRRAWSAGWSLHRDAYPTVLVLLFFGAIYEAVEVIYTIRLLPDRS